MCIRDSSAGAGPAGEQRICRGPCRDFEEQPRADGRVQRRRAKPVSYTHLGYSGTHVIYATRFGSIDRDFRLGEREVHLPAGVAHFLEHKMFEDEEDVYKRQTSTIESASMPNSVQRRNAKTNARQRPKAMQTPYQ